MSEVTETQLEALDELRKAYSDAERQEAAKKGEALADGSYPIKNEADLHNAIRAVGRGTQNSHNAIRRYIIGRAKSLSLSSLIPDNWNADGSITEAKSAEWDAEHRSGPSFKDRHSALSSAIRNQPNGGSLSAYLTDFDDDTATYESGGKIFQVPYTSGDDGSVKLGSPQEVHPVTSYQAVGTARNDDPEFEWRKHKVEQMSGRALEKRSFEAEKLEIREGSDDSWTLTGYASVTEHPYEVGFYTEKIARGAFKRTLKSDPDVTLLLNHDGLPLARTKAGTLILEEDRHGLFVEAHLDPQDPDAQTLARKLKRGDLDGQMSFAFIADDQTWSDDLSERTLNAVTINRGDVSIVTQGANPATTAQFRALEEAGPQGLETMFREYRSGDLSDDSTVLLAALSDLVEKRAGRVLSAQNVEGLKEVLGLVADADKSVDEAQPMLARILGMANPDKDGETNTESDGEPTPPIASSVTDGRSALISDSPLPDATIRARQRLEAMQRRAA